MKKQILISSAILFSSLCFGQIGVNTQHPKGVFHIDANSDNPTNSSDTPSASQQANDFIVTPKGAVGIGTINPNSTLAIKGFLEAGYKEVSSSYTLSETDHYVSYTGNMDASISLPSVGSGTTAFFGRIYKIKNISNNQLTIATKNSTDKLRNSSSEIPSFILPPGYYAEIVNNTNLSGSATWDVSFIGYPQLPAENWQFDNIYDYQASVPQNITGLESQIGPEIDLIGFSKTIIVPANRSAKIVISYSIPVGSSNPQGYYGVIMMKNNTEFIAGSRKFTQYTLPATGASWSMVTISATVADNIDISSSPQTINYKLRSYLENSKTVRYLMYDSNNSTNYNWGRAYWSLTVYLK